MNLNNQITVVIYFPWRSFFLVNFLQGGPQNRKASLGRGSHVSSPFFPFSYAAAPGALTRRRICELATATEYAKQRSLRSTPFPLPNLTSLNRLGPWLGLILLGPAEKMCGAKTRKAHGRPGEEAARNGRRLQPKAS